MKGTSPWFLSLAFSLLFATVVTGEWDSDYWPVTNKWFISKRHITDLQKAVSERHEAVNGTPYEFESAATGTQVVYRLTREVNYWNSTNETYTGEYTGTWAGVTSSYEFASYTNVVTNYSCSVGTNISSGDFADSVTFTNYTTGATHYVTNFFPALFFTSVVEQVTNVVVFPERSDVYTLETLSAVTSGYSTAAQAQGLGMWCGATNLFWIPYNWAGYIDEITNVLDQSVVDKFADMVSNYVSDAAFAAASHTNEMHSWGNPMPTWDDWYDLLEFTTGTNELPCLSSSNWFFCRQTLHAIWESINNLTYVWVQGFPSGTNNPAGTNEIGTAVLTTNETGTATYWNTNSWPNRTNLNQQTWPYYLIGSTYQDYPQATTNTQYIVQVESLNILYYDSFDGSCSGGASTNTDTTEIFMYCGTNSIPETDCPGCVDDPVNEDYYDCTTVTILSSNDNPCGWADQEDEYDDDPNWGGGTACTDPTCDPVKYAKRWSQPVKYTVSSNRFTKAGREYFFGQFNTGGDPPALFDTEDYVTADIDIDSFQTPYSTNMTVSSGPTNIFQYDLISSNLPYAGTMDYGTNRVSWGVHDAWLLLKYSVSNGFEYVE